MEKYKTEEEFNEVRVHGMQVKCVDIYLCECIGQFIWEW